MGLFGKYMVFRTQLYEIWKPYFNVESYIFFIHSEPGAYFVPRLPLRVSKSTTSWGHVSTGRNWTAEKLQNQNLTFQNKNTLVDGSFFPFSLIWYPFLSSFFTPSLRRSREPCIVFKKFSSFSSEAFNPKLQLHFSFFSPFSSQSPDQSYSIVPISSFQTSITCTFWLKF